MRIGLRDTVLQCPLDRAFDVARNLGYGGVEITLGGKDVREHPIWTRAGLRELQHYRTESRLDIIAIYVARFQRLGLLHEDDRVRENAERLLHMLLPRAVELGVRDVIVPLGNRTTFDADAVSILRRSVERAANFSVTLAFLVAAPAYEAARLLDALGEPARLAYDIADAVEAGRDPADELSQLADSVEQLRIRDLAEDREPRPLGLGIVNYRQLARTLHDTDYSGCLLLDVPSGDDPVATAAASLAFVQEILLSA
jgi:sugar phosphate isomerase/epimerase